MPFVYFILHPAFVALDARRERIVVPAKRRRDEKKRAETVANPSSASGTAPVPGPSDGSFAITEALYGIEGQWTNVTPIVAGLVTDGRLDLGVGNSTLGGDPLPNVPKFLRLSYWLYGSQHTTMVQEGNRVQLP